MTRQPTLKQLKYLCSVAEHGHFGNAAKACHVSQSTLSAGILELEEALGASLIERNNRQVILTSLGSDIVERAQTILLEVEDLVALCDASSAPFTGKMRLGVIPTVAPYILPGLLKRLRAEHSEFQLFIREDLSEHLIDGLQHGELDVLLLALPYPADKVETMHLFNDNFVFACPPDHALAEVGGVRTAQLKDQELLLLEDGHCLRDHALEACRLKDTEISVPYQATSLNTIVQMVANGIGVTLLPQMALDSQILSGTEVQTRAFDESGVSRSIGLMWRKKTPRRVEFTLLGKFIAEQCDKAKAA
ncbi:MAG: hydrogen peroxide-inducible genes activator [Pseudomonadota bacterium]